jgi:MFS family permease
MQITDAGRWLKFPDYPYQAQEGSFRRPSGVEGAPCSVRETKGVMRAYWFLAADIFLGFTAGGAAFPFFSLYATSLGASLGQVALVMGIQSAVGVVAGLLWGRIADRVGRRRPFIVGAQAATALRTLAIASVPTWGWLLPLQALVGVAGGAHQVTSMALMGDILEGHPRRGRLISGYRMSGSLAFSIAIVVSGWIAETIGLRGSFQLAAGVYALAFLVSLGITEAPRSAALHAESVSFAALLRGPLRPLLIVAFTFALPFAAVYSVWPIWVAETLGFGRAVYSRLWGIAAFVEVPCMLLSGLLIDRVGHRPTFVAGLAGFGLVYLLYVLSPPLSGLIAIQVLRGVAFAAFTATALTLAIDLAPPDARGRASGLFGSAQGLAQISGSWLGGPLAAALGFRGLFALAAALVLCGALYTYRVLGHTRPRAGAD